MQRRGKVVEIVSATHDIRILKVSLVGRKSLRFRAGQYLRMAFGSLPFRDYSIASRPDEPLLEFHIRRVADDGPSDYVVSSLRVGEGVKTEGPYGEAWLRERADTPILAVAGGTGLAPIKSIVETVLAQGSRPAIHLYHGVRSAADVYLENHFQDMAKRHPQLAYDVIFSEPGADTSRRHGLVGDAVAKDFTSLSRFDAYLAGPPAMVEHVTAILRDRGIAPDAIHSDPFVGDAEMTARGRI